MLASIPYTTFPLVKLGPITLKTFGLMVALGFLVGALVAARQAQRAGVSSDETLKVATRLLVAGLIGARITWVLTHFEEIHSPIDVVAVWNGGLQFSGGFLAAVLAGLPSFRRWAPSQRWVILDAYALGLTIGLAIGRIGCYSVGEHFGRTTNFFLGVTYRGGSTQEDFLGSTPLQKGMTFHQTALYEFVYLLILYGLMRLIISRSDAKGWVTPAGTLVGLFTLYYGVARFLSDSLRVNDSRVASLTGAQWMCLAMIPIGFAIIRRAKKGTLGTSRPSDGAATEHTDGAATEHTDGAATESTARQAGNLSDVANSDLAEAPGSPETAVLELD